MESYHFCLKQNGVENPRPYFTDYFTKSIGSKGAPSSGDHPLNIAGLEGLRSKILEMK